jgi:hypothetical protein
MSVVCFRLVFSQDFKTMSFDSQALLPESKEHARWWQTTNVGQRNPITKDGHAKHHENTNLYSQKSPATAVVSHKIVSSVILVAVREASDEM